MASMPPPTSGGPPPGATPQGLSRIPAGAGPSSGPTAPPEGGGQGLAKLFFQVEQALDAIASVVPQGSEKIDMIKSSLREVLAEAVSGGTPFTGNPSPDATPRGNGGPGPTPM